MSIEFLLIFLAVVVGGFSLLIFLGTMFVRLRGHKSAKASAEDAMNFAAAYLTMKPIRVPPVRLEKTTFKVSGGTAIGETIYMKIWRWYFFVRIRIAKDTAWFPNLSHEMVHVLLNDAGIKHDERLPEEVEAMARKRRS